MRYLKEIMDNLFDLILVCIVVYLCINYSFWWIMLLIFLNRLRNNYL
nr:MAG TPA: hypothetical protein [Caudoviricetes sp.]